MHVLTIKRASRLRRAIELWLMRRYMLRFGPAMVQRRGGWWYIDPTGIVWAVTPSDDLAYPLVISRVSDEWN
jgi:hypothetical protein